MTDRGPARILPSISMPPHLGVMLGLSTCAYALSLAAVTRLQSATETRIATERAPAIAALAAVTARHDGLDRDLSAARGAYASAAASYAAAGAAFQAVEQRLGALAAIVADINGTVASMPTSVRMPPVSRVVAPRSAPATHATTGASGG